MFVLMLTFTFTYWPQKCSYGSTGNINLHSPICGVGLQNLHSKAQYDTEADENRLFCNRLLNILAVLKSHFKSYEISFRKLFSLKIYY